MTSIRGNEHDPVADAEHEWVIRGWGAAAPGMAAITSVLRTNRLYQAQVDGVLSALHLNWSRYEVLMLLYFARRGMHVLGVISERLQLNPATITNTVSRLERSGYVRRVPNPEDGRGRLAMITDLGREVALEATMLVNSEVFEDIGLSKDEMQRLNHLLWKLRSRFR